MTLRIVLCTAALTLASAFAASASCALHQQTMSCADGTTWDAETETCVPRTTS